MRANPLVYVTMPFTPEFEDVWLVVEAVFPSYGWQVARADIAATSAPQMNAAYDMIEQADLVVADLSGSSPTTMYELGIAHGMRKPTVLFLRTDSSTNVPFDVSSYQMLTYSNASELEKNLHRVASYATRAETGPR
jgi:nucleoside 2-deoxyribosyltransferase